VCGFAVSSSFSFVFGHQSDQEQRRVDDLPSIEAVAEYWNRRPCNVRHSAAERGSRQYYDEVEQRRYFVEPHIPEFAQFQRWAGRRVLEVGCGIATDAVNFARAGADYTGVDVSETSLALARQRFDVFKLPGRFFLANAEDLARLLEPGSFDLVYSFGVIHHTPRPDAAAHQIRRLVKADGEFRLMLYARDSWKSAMIEVGLDQPEAQSGCPLALSYTRQQVHELLEPAGFRILSITQDHIFPYVIEDYVRYEYKLQPWFSVMPSEVFRALQRRFGWHLLIVASPD
jgi:SAM-dependent methyltransferase